jgi:hypothetical protein
VRVGLGSGDSTTSPDEEALGVADALAGTVDSADGEGETDAGMLAPGTAAAELAGACGAALLGTTVAPTLDANDGTAVGARLGLTTAVVAPAVTMGAGDSVGEADSAAAATPAFAASNAPKVTAAAAAIRPIARHCRKAGAAHVDRCVVTMAGTSPDVLVARAFRTCGA